VPGGIAVQQLELLLRAALRNPANELIGFLLQQAATQIDQSYQAKTGECWKGSFPLQVTGIFGSFTVWRHYYYNPRNKQGHHPADAALGLEGACTPALTRLICMEGADENSFQKAQTHLKETGAIEIEARQIQRIIQQVGPAAGAWAKRDEKPEPCDAPIMYVSADGTGVPMRKSETRGRRGKQLNGDSQTREVKLGCIFTRHALDKDGNPIRDHDGTSYLATFDNAMQLGRRVLKEARRRGLAYAQQLVVIGDGARWIWNQSRINFPEAIEILDFYHACEHLQLLATAITPNISEIKKLTTRWRHWIERDQIDKVMNDAQSRLPAHRQRRKTTMKQLAYFKLNAARMRYKTFQKMHLFIGSGVVEAGCKTVVGKRTKQSGMLWTVSGAQDVLDIRCCILSHDYDAFWLSLRPHAA